MENMLKKATADGKLIWVFVTKAMHDLVYSIGNEDITTTDESDDETEDSLSSLRSSEEEICLVSCSNLPVARQSNIQGQPWDAHLALPGDAHIAFTGDVDLALQGDAHISLPGDAHLTLQGDAHLALPGTNYNTIVVEETTDVTSSTAKIDKIGSDTKVPKSDKKRSHPDVSSADNDSPVVHYKRSSQPIRRRYKIFSSSSEDDVEVTRTVNAGRKDKVADQVKKDCKKPEGKKATKNYYIKKDSNKHDVKKDSKKHNVKKDSKKHHVNEVSENQDAKTDSRKHDVKKKPKHDYKESKHHI